MHHPLLRASFELLDERGVSGTRQVTIEADAADHVAEILEESSVARGPLLLLDDPTTHDVAGCRALRSFKRRGWPVVHHCCVTADGSALRCTDRSVDALFDELRDAHVTHVLAVGAGTVTDIAKLFAADRDIPVYSFATAPSMNGYTSAISAILLDGIKQTVPTRAPAVCVADPRVLADAPASMIGAGLGDAYSRFVASSDWKLSHRLHGTVYDAPLASLLERAARSLRSIPPRLSSDRGAAVEELAIILYVTGLAQQAALPGTQASGGEHLVSHYLDMLAGHPDFAHHADLHGRQVAVGTLFAARVFERLRDLPFDRLDPEALAASHPTREEFEASIRAHFRGLADSVLRKTLRSYPSRRRLIEQLRGYELAAFDLDGEAMAPWTPVETLEAELAMGGAPVSFEEIGVNERLMRDVTVWCRHVRDRFTALHLGGQLGFDEEIFVRIGTGMLHAR